MRKSRIAGGNPRGGKEGEGDGTNCRINFANFCTRVANCFSQENRGTEVVVKIKKLNF